jgi:hypothetical protein
MTDTARKEKPALDDKDPAKGGVEQPARKPYPSGDSPKPHGDKLEDAVDSAVRKDR